MLRKSPRADRLSAQGNLFNRIMRLGAIRTTGAQL